MGAFSVKAKGLDFLEKRIKNAHIKITEQYIKIIDESVIEISKLAENKVPRGKTDILAGSIGYTLYNVASGASVYASAHYAPYVEFGTGQNFGIPSYRNINSSKLNAYAFTFKRKKQVIGRPYKPFMFNSYSEVYTKMLGKLKKIKI
jgi:hypothetical protein